MSRAKSSRPNKGANSFGNQQFQDYMGAGGAVNQVPIDNRSKFSYNDEPFVPEFPSDINLLEVGGNHFGNNETSKAHKTTRNRRKKSFNEGASMMKDVPNGDNINGDKQEAMYRVKSEATKDKNFTSKVQAYYNDIEVIGKVDPFTSTKDTQPPKVKATKPERFEIKLSENIGRTSTNKASSKITNPNIVMMSLSDSIEEKKPHTLMRPKSKQVADTSSVMIDTEEHVESPASKARYSLIKQAVPHLQTSEFDFLREKKCCNGLVNPQYTLSFKNGGFVMNAKKQFGYFNSCYFITGCENEYEDKKEAYMGYIKGNFTGSQFSIYQSSGGDTHQLVATICYESGFKCSSFRKIEVYVKNPAYKEPIETKGKSLQELYEGIENVVNKNILKLVTKQPKYNQKHSCYIMNFKGKSKLASTKNMVLVEEQNPEDYLLMFCKTDKHDFHLEAVYPLSPLIAFGVVLSGFDFKLCCQ